MITSLVLIETIALIAICLTVGKIVAQLLMKTKRAKLKKFAHVRSTRY